MPEWVISVSPRRTMADPGVGDSLSWKVVLSIVVVALAVLVQSGCGYSLAGRGSFLPVYIKRIGIPLFTNATTVFELDRRVTDKVRAEFIGRGKYAVTNDAIGADAMLTGEIVNISVQPVGFT